MPIKIKTTKDVTVNGVKIAIFGYAGSGKTRLCSTAKNAIIISAESGLLSLADYDIPYIEVNTLQDIGDAYKFLKENDDYDTIIIDSLSEIAEVLIHKFKSDPEVKDKRQSYGKLADALIPMIRNFRDMKGKNVIFTAKARRVTDEDSGITTIEVFMPGQLTGLQVPFLVDEMLYAEVDRKGNRALICHPTRALAVKDRSGKLDAKEPMDLDHIMDKIKGVNTKKG